MHKANSHGIINNNMGLGINFNLGMMNRPFIPGQFINNVNVIGLGQINPYIAVTQNQNNGINNINNNVNNVS